MASESSVRAVKHTAGDAERNAEKLEQAEETIRELKKKVIEVETARDENARRLKLVESDLERAEDRADEAEEKVGVSN